MQKLLKLSIFSFVLLLGFSSCGDDDCEPGSIQETLVGTWSNAFESSSAEFQADGTLVDPDDVVFGIEVNGVSFDEKTWEIDTDGNLFITASNGTNTSDTTFEVGDFTCDEVVLSTFGLAVTFERQ